MNREEAIVIIRKEYLCVDRDCDIERSCGKCDLMMPSKEPILEAYKMAIKALEQMPVTTTAGEGGVIYYPQVEGVTPTVVDAGKQERDAIDRKLVCAFIDGLISDDGERKKGLEYIRHMPPVNPQPCEDAISRQAVRHILNHEVKMPIKVWKKVFELVDDLPPVIPQPKTGHWIDDNENEIDAQYGRHLYKCSECNEYADMFVGGTEDWWDLEKPNYCPNCGCRMFEPQESEDDEQIKVGTKVRTIKDKDFAGEEVFPVETIGIVEEIRKGGKLPYIIRANSDYWYYSRDMFEVIEDIEPQERSDKA